MSWNDLQPGKLFPLALIIVLSSSLVDSTCKKLTKCASNEIELVSPTATSDRICDEITGSRSQSAKFSAFLDEEENILLNWNLFPENNTIYLYLTAQVDGWIGLGFNTFPSMVGADMVIAWPKEDGSFHFTDRHAGALSRPIVDASADYELLFALRNETHIILEMRRPLYTCDEDDYDFKGGTTRVLWAFGNSVPTSESEFLYHGAVNRGAKSINFLMSMPANHPEDMQGASYVDLLSNNFELPAQRTEYLCKAFQLPEVTEKHHIISWEPIIEPKNKGRVHHILIYQCNDMTEDELSFSATCHGNMPDVLKDCRVGTPIASWAVGQEQVFLPSHVGFPMGPGTGNARHLLAEVHYDNPEEIAFTDNSGIRFYYTSSLREFDAAILQVGHMVTTDMVIPPNVEEFTIRSLCPSGCTANHLDHDIVLLGSFLHEHLAGTGVKVRHIRQGKELEPLGDDPDYDFNYQALNLYPEPHVVKPGDDILIECQYRTDQHQMDLLKRVGYDIRFNETKVVGGEGTGEEMCLGYFLYYPKADIDRCWPTRVPFGDDHDFIDKEGVWSEEEINEWQDRYVDPIYAWPCTNYPVFVHPEITEPLPPPETGCPANSTTTAPTTPSAPCVDNDALASELCQYLFDKPCTCAQVAGGCTIADSYVGDLIRHGCPSACSVCPGQTPSQVCEDKNELARELTDLFIGSEWPCSSISILCGSDDVLGSFVRAMCPESCGACPARRRNIRSSVDECQADEYYDGSTSPSTDNQDDRLSIGVILGVFFGTFILAFVLGILIVNSFPNQQHQYLDPPSKQTLVGSTTNAAWEPPVSDISDFD